MSLSLEVSCAITLVMCQDTADMNQSGHTLISLLIISQVFQYTSEHADKCKALCIISSPDLVNERIAALPIRIPSNIRFLTIKLFKSVI